MFSNTPVCGQNVNKSSELIGLRNMTNNPELKLQLNEPQWAQFWFQQS